MPSFKTFASLGVITAFCLTGCQSAPICDKDRATIGAASDDYFRQAEAGKMDAVGAYYTEDAVLMPPGGEAVKGRKAITAFFSHFPKLEKMHWERHDVTGNGDLAYSQGMFSFEMHAPGATKPVVEKGKFIEIWRRQPDGAWKISRDIYNSNIAP